MAIASFGLILVALATVGLFGRCRRPPIVSGIPQHPAVSAAVAELGGPPTVLTGDLRFSTSLDTVGMTTGRRRTGVEPQRLEEAARLLREAQAALPGDPRVDCLMGHIELSRHRFELARRHYASALTGGARYGEARLGFGLALALGGQVETDARRSRGLTLRAIAQMAAVDERDPCYLPALYDRALLLARAGRVDEAGRLARRYRELDPRSPWVALLGPALSRQAAAAR